MRRRKTLALVGAALVAALAVSTLAAALAISQASWSTRQLKLSISGTGAAGGTVTVTNARTGAAVGSTKVNQHGTWLVGVSQPASVPCRVRATQAGSSVESDVEGAPANCAGPAVTLSSLGVSGPSTMDEGTTASYKASAMYSDGSTKDVTAAATWSENSDYTTVAGGTLTAAAVPSTQAVTITASFTESGVTRSASMAVSVRDVPTLASVTVTGPASLLENSTASYAATATYSDGSSKNVTTLATWSEDSAYATVAAGQLTTAAVSSNQPVNVGASYTDRGITQSGVLAVTIQDAPAVTGSHAGRFMTYEGTATCLKCHQSEAEALHQSTHYQWKGDASESTGLNSLVAGKLGGINDFCIYPDINWLGKLTTVDGKLVDGGCARCHTGKALKPTPDITQAQLENIDCLVCHSPSYKRTLQPVNGVLTFVPDTANMTVSVLQAAVDIRKPGSDQCLNCHTKAGGGNNLKRGDIEEAHRPATATVGLDVHMTPVSAGGAGLTCTSCHTTVGHRIAGRGVDMRQRDLLNAPVKCANCHTLAPHDDSSLNRHTARLECNVCHVPAFAKGAPTDMRRDWSVPGDLNPVTALYEPHMDLRTQVQPVYRFFNGRSVFYQFGTRAVAQANGRVLMAGPLGSITEPGSKITAMKRHEGRQPIDPITGWLLPLKIGIFFQTNNVPLAITEGVKAMGWPANGYAFAETERFMGVYHEVAPHDQALKCDNCHGGGRMDFAGLGYTPLPTRNGKPLCASCHSARTAGFQDLHDKHVRERGFDCSTCHIFTKAQ